MITHVGSWCSMLALSVLAFGVATPGDSAELNPAALIYNCPIS